LLSVLEDIKGIILFKTELKKHIRLTTRCHIKVERLNHCGQGGKFFAILCGYPLWESGSNSQHAACWG